MIIFDYTDSFAIVSRVASEVVFPDGVSYDFYVDVSVAVTG